jgi:hypothetical protein
VKPHHDDGTIGVAVQHRILAAAVFALIFAPCPSFAQGAGAPIHPVKTEMVRITTRAPEPDKWTATSTLNGTVRVFQCKAHACSDPITVSFTFHKGSVKPPSPKALERFATVDLPKTIRAAAAARSVMTDRVDMIETLSSTTATLKNYPSVLNETKFTHGRVSSVFLETGVIFVNPLVIRVESSSRNRKLARKSLVEFIETMQIVVKSGPAPSRPSKIQSL